MSINHYATNFYKKISSEIDTNNITGEKLLNITQCHHINLFIIKKIYDDWLNNFNKNKIPFFDYDNKETKKAQKNFMNTFLKLLITYQMHNKTRQAHRKEHFFFLYTAQNP